MSVLIKGMKMPTSCAECSNRRCGLLREVKRPAYQRHKYCPLVPVPPHGRLGDLDALAQLFKEKAAEHGGIGGIMVAMAAGCIDAAPTIIPAEEEGEA